MVACVERPAQGIRAIPSEYTCLKKMATPSDHDLETPAATSALSTFFQFNVRWVFHIWVAGTVDSISFDLFRHDVHRATRTAILGPNLFFVVIDYVEKADERLLGGALL